MPFPTAPALEIGEHERVILEKISREPSNPQGMVKRAQIVLKAGEGQSNAAIARDLKLARNTVLLWRERWQGGAEKRQAMVAEKVSDKELREVIEAHLRDAYRSGTPGKFSAEQMVQIIALACEDPQASGYPVSHWTPREVAAEAIKRGIVATISERQVGRFLK